MKFCLLTLTGPDHPVSGGADCAFFLHDVADLSSDGRRFRLPEDAIGLLSPNTGTALVLRSRRDAMLALATYRRIPVLFQEQHGTARQWAIQTRPGHFHMSNDAEAFRSSDAKPDSGILPLYEAKMTHQFEHRWASATGDELGAQERRDPDLPRATTILASSRTRRCTTPRPHCVMAPSCEGHHQ